MDGKAPLVPSCRLTLSLFGCMALMFLYILRVNLSLSLVCMIKSPPSFSQASQQEGGNATIYNNETLASHSQYDNSTDSIGQRNTSRYEGEFEWSRQFQGHVLSSYFYGYLMTQFLGGWLAGRYGGKHVLGSGVLISAVTTFVTPSLTRLNSYLVIVLRVILGASSGVIFSSVQSLWGVWAPPLERSFLSSLSFLGMTFGSIAALLISTAFCEVPFDNGWPLVFYVTGGCSVIFYILWNVFVFNSPDQHPRISAREREYIKSCTGISKVAKTRDTFPWLKAITSPAVLAIMAAQASSTWFTYTGLTSLPLYMKEVLKFDIKQNGLFLILPHLAVLATSVPSAHLADVLRRRGILSTVTVRKIYQGISCLGCSVLLIILSFIDYERRYLAVAILTVIFPTQTLCRAGFIVNPQDIAPRFSGEIFGMTNTIGTVSGILAPIVVGMLTPSGTREEWQKVFYISAGFFIFGGIIFIIFAKGDVLSWAMPSDVTKVNVDKNENIELLAKKKKVPTATLR